MGWKYIAHIHGKGDPSLSIGLLAFWGDGNKGMRYYRTIAFRFAYHRARVFPISSLLFSERKRLTNKSDVSPSDRIV